MQLVPRIDTGPRRFKTQWSTTSDNFRDVPEDTPESDEWVDRPDHPARRGGGVPDRRAGVAGQYRYRHSRFSPTGLIEHVAQMFQNIKSDQAIPIVFNDEDDPLAGLVSAALLQLGQHPVISTPSPRLRDNGMLDADWRQKYLPFLSAAEYAVDIARPGEPPNSAKVWELQALRSGGARIIPFWIEYEAPDIESELPWLHKPE